MRITLWIKGLIGTVIGCLLFGVVSAELVQAAPDISTHAQATALIDVQSGRILYSEDGDTPMRIASLTKIMTALVAIEYGDLSSKATVTKRAAGREGSSIYLKLGEEMTLSNMLYGLMLRSGNDAATAIAEHVGGSEAGFVYLMNEKALELGLLNTQFRNPHGLDEPEHLSSANDLAVLTAYALKNKVSLKSSRLRKSRLLIHTRNGTILGVTKIRCFICMKVLMELKRVTQNKHSVAL